MKHSILALLQHLYHLFQKILPILRLHLALPLDELEVEIVWDALNRYTFHQLTSMINNYQFSAYICINCYLLSLSFIANSI